MLMPERRQFQNSNCQGPQIGVYQTCSGKIILFRTHLHTEKSILHLYLEKKKSQMGKVTPIKVIQTGSSKTLLSPEAAS